MEFRRVSLSLIGVFVLGLLAAGCSDNPTDEEVPVALTASLAGATIAYGDSVAITYELTGNVETQWVMAQFVEPDGDVSVAGFQDGSKTRYIGPLFESGEYSIFVRALTTADEELSTSPPMVFTVLDE